MVMRRDGGNLIEWVEHPITRLIRDGPNELQSWSDWVEWLLASALLQGNALAVIERDQRGAPSALYPIPWWCCQPQLVAAPAVGPRPWCRTHGSHSTSCNRKHPWPLPGGYTATGGDNGGFSADAGRSAAAEGPQRRRDPRTLAAVAVPGAVACAIGAQGFSEGVWANGAVIGGVLKHPGKLGDEAAKNLAQSWRDTHLGRLRNAGRTAVLEEGMTFDRIGVSPEDAELLDSRRFSVVELCRLFNVPPAVVGGFRRTAISRRAMRR
jgi:phage portal protein BeeE